MNWCHEHILLELLSLCGVSKWEGYWYCILTFPETRPSKGSWARMAWYIFEVYFPTLHRLQLIFQKTIIYRSIFSTIHITSVLVRKKKMPRKSQIGNFCELLILENSFLDSSYLFSFLFSSSYFFLHFQLREKFCLQETWLVSFRFFIVEIFSGPDLKNSGYLIIIFTKQ